MTDNVRDVRLTRVPLPIYLAHRRSIGTRKLAPEHGSGANIAGTGQLPSDRSAVSCGKRWWDGHEAARTAPDNPTDAAPDALDAADRRALAELIRRTHRYAHVALAAAAADPAAGSRRRGTVGAAC